MSANRRRVPSDLRLRYPAILDCDQRTRSGISESADARTAIPVVISTIFVVIPAIFVVIPAIFVVIAAIFVVIPAIFVVIPAKAGTQAATRSPLSRG
jgi:hypothetical protein